MSVLQAEVYQAFRTLDVPDDKALSAAVALSSAFGNVADETARGSSKRDADIEAIRKGMDGIRADVVGIKLDVAGMKGEIGLLKWMMGTTIALLVTVLFRVFTH